MAHQIPPPGEGCYGPDSTAADYQYQNYQYAQSQGQQELYSPVPPQQPYPHQGHQPHSQPTEQPGLELHQQQPNWADGLEVVPSEQLKHTQHWPEVRQEEVGKELSPTTALVSQWKWKDERDQYNAGQAPEVVDGPVVVSGKPNKRRKRLWIILGCVLAVIVIVGAVVGGVVGAKAGNSKGSATAPVPDTGDDGDSTSTVPSPSKTTTGGGGAAATSAAPVAGAIKAGSPLTVTGWRNDKGNVGLYLFYQDKSNDVFYIKYDGTAWGKPVSMIKGLKRDTKLTATIILNGFGNTKKVCPPSSLRDRVLVANRRVYTSLMYYSPTLAPALPCSKRY